MTSIGGLLFFFLFCVIQVITYVVVRRRLLPSAVMGLISVVGGIISITLMALAQETNIYQAVFAGIVVGLPLSGGTLAMALYFLRSEQRLAQAPPDDENARYMPPNEAEPPSA